MNLTEAGWVYTGKKGWGPQGKGLQRRVYILLQAFSSNFSRCSQKRLGKSKNLQIGDKGIEGSEKQWESMWRKKVTMCRENQGNAEILSVHTQPITPLRILVPSVHYCWSYRGTGLKEEPKYLNLDCFPGDFTYIESLQLFSCYHVTVSWPQREYL